MSDRPTGETTEWLSQRLDDRIIALLESNPGHLAFNGLRRALQAHPESLQRALKRLERGGVVVRDPLGYALAHGDELARAEPMPRAPAVLHEVARVELPAVSDPEDALGRLAGRWVGPLRWVGFLEAGEVPRLLWAVPGVDGRVAATVVDGRLRIEVEADREPVAARLLDAARELVVYSVRSLVTATPKSSVGVAQFGPHGVPRDGWAS